MANKDPGVVIDLRTQIGLAALLSLCGLILCTLFIRFQAWDNFLTFLVAVGAGLGVVYAGYYARETLTSSIRRESIRYSLKLTNVLNGREMNEIRAKIREIDHRKLSPEEIQAKIDGDPALSAQVNTLLGYLEDVSIAIQTLCADEPTLYRSLNVTIAYYFEMFHDYIREEREQLKNQELSREVERLYQAWRDGKSIVTGEQLGE